VFVSAGAGSQGLGHALWVVLRGAGRRNGEGRGGARVAGMGRRFYRWESVVVGAVRVGVSCGVRGRVVWARATVGVGVCVLGAVLFGVSLLARVPAILARIVAGALFRGWDESTVVRTSRCEF